MKRLFTFLYIVCIIQFCNAQKLQDLYLNPTTNKFTLVTYEDGFDCQSKSSNFYNIYQYEFQNKIKNNAFQSALIKQYPTTLVNDTDFLSQNNINKSDTLRCLVDTNNQIYPITDQFAFYYNNHVIDESTNNIYQLALQDKFIGYYETEYMHCNENYYILKSKNYQNNNNSTSLNENYTIDKFYKFPYQADYNYKLLKRNNNSLLLIENLPTNNIIDTVLNYKLIELDSNLDIIQTKNFSHEIFSDSFYAYNNFNFKEIGNKNYLIAYTEDFQFGNRIYYKSYVFEYDNNFNLLESKKFNTFYEEENYFNNKKGNHYFFYETDSSTVIHVTDAANDTIREINLTTKNKILISNDSSFIVLNPEIIYYVRADIFVYKYNKNGVLLRKTSLYEMLGINMYDDLHPIKYDIDSFNNIMFAYSVSFGGCDNSSQLTNGVFNLDALNYISGTITNDINYNCQKDSLENPVKNILVELQLNGKKHYTLSDELGNYKFTPYDTGHGKIILHLENQSVFTNACNDTFDIVIADTLANPIVNFLLQTPTCSTKTPKVTVDISTPFLRRCFDNIYTLTITNESNDTAFNTFVDVELDNDLIAVDTAFLSAENLGNNSYRFNFGTLIPFEKTRKNLVIKVGCDSTILGQTHCVKATTQPYIICGILDQHYMQAQALCRNDSVIFTIKNIGYPLDLQQAYRVIVDDSIQYSGTLYFTQPISITTLSYYNPSGKTYRLETRQYPIFIGEDTILSVAIEGCGNSNFSTGFITQFSQDDDAPNVSIDCHQNVGSFDPNEKTANPIGFGNAHLVEDKQAITYTIHFQNLGSYYASNVTILDTLSANFDITTFKTIGASHDYSVSIIDSNILQFTFQNIDLIDASSDSLLSNGFIKFSVKPKANTAIGTAINNNAFITFDYNEAIQTNTVQHQIGKNFLNASIILLTKNNLYKNVNIKVYPNPASHQFTFEIVKEVPKNATLHFYTINGKEIFVENNLSLINTINAINWSKGMYLFELKNESTLLQSGKIVIE